MIYSFSEYQCKNLKAKKIQNRVRCEKTKPTERTVGFCDEPSDSDKPEDETLDSFILTGEPNLYKQMRQSVSKEKFIKLIRSQEVEFLLEYYPNVFLLLTQIAYRARRIAGNCDGLDIGEAFIGDYKKAGIESRKKYRTALIVCVQRKYIKIIENCRNRKKGACGRATIGTKVSLLNSNIWDINIEIEGHPKGHRGATEGPPKGHEQECKEGKDMSVSVCSPTLAGTESEKNDPQKKIVHEISKIIKTKPGGEKLEIILDEILKKAITERKDWTTQEIFEAWEILNNTKELVRDGWLYIQGTIKNLRTKKRMENWNKKPKETKWKSKTKNEIKIENNSSMTSNKISLGIAMPGQPSLQSLLDQHLKDKQDNKCPQK